MGGQRTGIEMNCAYCHAFARGRPVVGRVRPVVRSTGNVFAVPGNRSERVRLGVHVLHGPGVSRTVPVRSGSSETRRGQPAAIERAGAEHFRRERNGWQGSRYVPRREWFSTCCPASSEGVGRLRPTRPRPALLPMMPLRPTQAHPRPKEKARDHPVPVTVGVDVRPASSRLGAWRDGHRPGVISGSVTRGRRSVRERRGVRPARTGASGS